MSISRHFPSFIHIVLHYCPKVPMDSSYHVGMVDLDEHVSECRLWRGNNPGARIRDPKRQNFRLQVHPQNRFHRLSASKTKQIIN